MWKQINFGVEIAAAVADSVLLLRVLGLRLHQTYLFVTLACTLFVLFDAAHLLFPTDRVAVYSDIYRSCILPLAVWSVFDEISETAGDLRRLCMIRMLGGLILMSLIGLIWLSSISDVPDSTGLEFTNTVAIFVSLIVSSSCLSYLWMMWRGMRLLKIAQGRNTQTWMMFFAFILAIAFLYCLMIDIAQFLDPAARLAFGNIVVLVLNTIEIGITLWCAVKLRGLSKDLPVPASESEPPA